MKTKYKVTSKIFITLPSDYYLVPSFHLEY